MNCEMRFLLNHVKGWRKKLALNTVLATILILLDILPQLLLGRVADVITGQTNSWIGAWGIEKTFGQIVVLGLVLAFIFILRSIFGYLTKERWNHFAQTIQHEVRKKTYGHVQSLDMAWFQERSTGSLISLLHNDVTKLENFFFHGLRDIIEMGVSVVVITAVCCSLSPRIACCLFVSIPLALLVGRGLEKNIYTHYKQTRKSASLLHAKLNNYLQGIAALKSYGLENSSRADIERISEDHRTHMNKARKASFVINPVIRTLLLPSYLFMLIGGGWLVVVEKSMSPGNYVSLILLITEIEWPIRFLGSIMDHYQSALASAQRLGALLRTRPLIQNSALPIKMGPLQGAVALENVSFAYEAKTKILAHLSLAIPPGAYVGLVGTTGVGKSTLLKLLLRFYDPEEGCVRLDGIDLRKLDLAEVRKAIGFVDQGFYLFDATIGENLTWGNEQISPEKMEEVVKLVDLDKFIASLERGYDTAVGEHGIKLSQGERQRLCIARALLKDPPILLFDEATSAVDNDTEKIIQEALLKLKGSKTIIVVAHRLSTVRCADKIYVLGQRRVLESGTHEALLEGGKAYRRLWDAQMGKG